MTAERGVLLDARQVLSGGFGRYWQFTTHSANRGAPDPDAVYVPAARVPELESVLAIHVRWFIPHGTSRLFAGEIEMLTKALSQLARMPDEGERTVTWQALEHWLITRKTEAVFVRLQVFR